MRGAPLPLALAALMMEACQPDGTLLTVRVNGASAAVRSLEVQARVDGVPAEGGARQVPLGPSAFRILLPERRDGLLRLAVAGLDEGRCQIEAGSLTQVLSGDTAYEAQLTLSPTLPGCSVHLTRVGAGQGAVLLPDGTQCASSCLVKGRRGEAVTLVRTDVPGDYFGGWYGACGGHDARCVVTLTGAAASVRADFLRSAEWGCLSSFCPESSPAPADLRGLWGSEAGDVWAVGGGGAILRSDGVRWHAVPSLDGRQLNAVWGALSSQVWLVGQAGAILRFDGDELRAVESGTARDLLAVWGNGTASAWAVGEGGTILRWDGMRWSAEESGTHLALRGLWGSGLGEVWAVGDDGTILRRGTGGWSRVPGGTARALHAVGGSSTSDVWAVGDEGTILRWQGASWVPFASGVTERLLGVWSKADALTLVVGERGTLLRLAGVQWDTVPTGTQAGLRCAWGYGPFDVWAIGEAGTILRYRP